MLSRAAKETLGGFPFETPTRHIKETGTVFTLDDLIPPSLPKVAYTISDLAAPYQKWLRNGGHCTRSKDPTVHLVDFKPPFLKELFKRVLKALFEVNC